MTPSRRAPAQPHAPGPPPTRRQTLADFDPEDAVPAAPPPPRPPRRPPVVMVPAWIVESRRLASSDARVLLELCRHQDWTTHQCYPSIPCLARDTRLSKDTVRTARNHLVEIGAIQPRGVHPRWRTEIWKIICERPAASTGN